MAKEILARAAGFNWADGEEFIGRYEGDRMMDIKGEEPARLLIFMGEDGVKRERWSNFQFDSLLDAGTVKYPVKAGDVLYIKAGKVKDLKATDTRPEGHKFRTFDVVRLRGNDIPSSLRTSEKEPAKASVKKA